MQLLAGGAATYLEAGAPQNAPILSAIPPASFAGIALTLLPWLTGGGTLSLHHGFDRDTFAAQAQDQDTVDRAAGPGLAALSQAGMLGGAIQILLSRCGARPSNWYRPRSGAARRALVDVASFGEIAMLAARRGNYGLPADIPYGKVSAPRAGGTACHCRDRAQQERHAVGARTHGAAARLSARRGSRRYPHFAADDTGFVDTGFTCRLEAAAKTLTVTGPPGGIATIGGYRFQASDVEAQVADADPTATVVALPGGLLAQKLAGSALDNGAVAAQLLENGANPLDLPGRFGRAAQRKPPDRVARIR